MEMVYVLMRALAHAPADRYPSVEEMLAHVRRIQDGQVAVQCHVTAFKRLAYESIHWVDRHPGLYSLAVLALLGGLVYGGYRLVSALIMAS